MAEEVAAHLCHALHRTGHGQDALVNAGDDLADACFDAGLLPEFCDIFSSLADDNASILGANEGAEGQGIGAAGGGRAGLRGRAWRRTR